MPGAASADPAGASDAVSPMLLSGMALYALSDNVRTFAPIVHDIVDVSDKRKMSYRQKYVEDDTQFSLRKSYTISGGTERNLNRGRMDSLTAGQDKNSLESAHSLAVKDIVRHKR